jgi:hypothetical protein
MFALAGLFPFWLFALCATALTIEPLMNDVTDCYNARFILNMTVSTSRISISDSPFDILT